MMRGLLNKLFLDPDKIATPTARRIFLSEENVSESDEFAFFSSLKLPTGVTKTTDRNRMRDVDEWLAGFIDTGEFHEILDVGISSGVTTVELAELLDQRRVKYRLTGLDSDLTAYLVTFGKDRSVLLDKTGNPIHFEIDGRGFGYVRGTNPRHFYDRAVLRLQTEFLLRARLKSRLGPAAQKWDRNGTSIRKIELVCRKVKENPSIDLLEESIFAEGNGRKYSVIRAANILNRSYFTDSRLADAVGKLGKRLKPGGLFLVCRTAFQGPNNATAFRLGADGGFAVAGRFGSGSEIEDVVTRRRA
jgi:hypothetical protein